MTGQLFVLLLNDFTKFDFFTYRYRQPTFELPESGSVPNSLRLKKSAAKLRIISVLQL